MIDCGSQGQGSFCGEVKISQLADAIDDNIDFDGGMRRICKLQGCLANPDAGNSDDLGNSTTTTSSFTTDQTTTTVMS